MSILIRPQKRISQPNQSVKLDLGHPALIDRILALNFNTDDVNNIDPNYIRKYTGVLGVPVYPQKIIKTGTDINRVEGGIRLNATSTGNSYKTSTGIDSFASATASITFLARFKVNRFISGGSSFNSIFCLNTAISTFSVAIDSTGKIYCNATNTLLGTVSFGEWVNLEITQKPSGASVAYLNNKKVNFTSGTNSAASSNAFWVASDSAGNRSCDLTISHVIAISPGIDVFGLHNTNPWQIFAKKQTPVFYSVWGAGSTLTGDNSNQANTSSSSSVEQTHVTTGENSSQANTSSTAVITQTHITTGTNSSQSNSSSTAAIIAAGALTGANSDQANASSSAAASQTHVTTGANSSQSNASTIGEINQTHILDGVGSDQENNLSTAGIIQQHTQHTLIGINSVQNNQSSTAGIISPTADTEILVISNKQILAIANRETITGVSNKSFNSEADLCLH